jgi:hypothetical protein
MLQDLADELAATGLSASSIRNTILPLRAIYRRALDRGQVALNPTLKLALPAVRGTRERIAIPSEATTLLDTLPPPSGRSGPPCGVHKLDLPANRHILGRGRVYAPHGHRSHACIRLRPLELAVGERSANVDDPTVAIDVAFLERDPLGRPRRPR